MFDVIKNKDSFTSIATINAELSGILVKRLHLCLLLRLLERDVFSTNIVRNMQVILASLNERSTEESNSDEEAIQELAEGEIHHQRFCFTESFAAVQLRVQ